MISSKLDQDQLGEVPVTPAGSRSAAGNIEHEAQIATGAASARTAEEPAAPSSDPAPAAPSPGPAPAVSKDISEYQTKFLDAITDLTTSPIEDQSGTGVFKTSDTKQRTVIARLINVTGRLDDYQGMDGIYRQAYFASQLLKNGRAAASDTVINILDDIEFRSSRNSPIYSVMSGLYRFVMVFTVLLIIFCGVYVWFSARAANVPWDQVVSGPLFSLFTSSPIIVAAVFGILGSVVSIMLRLSEFEGATRRSRQFLAMTGAMLPIVGGIFACVTCALFASGIINFNFANNTANAVNSASGESSMKAAVRAAAIDNIYFYVVVGFLSGFSERFTRGLLGTAEQTVSSSMLTKQTVATTDDGRVAAADTTAVRSIIRKT